MLPVSLGTVGAFNYYVLPSGAKFSGQVDAGIAALRMFFWRFPLKGVRPVTQFWQPTGLKLNDDAEREFRVSSQSAERIVHV